MPCNNPITGYRAPGGQVTFNRQEGWIDREITVPCGRCMGCRLERSRQWAVRIMHEAQMYEPWQTHFITLTYNDENLPAYGNLRKKDWQDFAKRWRKKHGKFRYYHCGEYGTKYGRPHYHAAVFGMELDLQVDGKTKSGALAYYSQDLEETWGKGRTQVGSLTFESAAYVARYITKKIGGRRRIEDNPYAVYDPETGEQVFEKQEEYVTMSRGRREDGDGGIGYRWIKRWNKDVYRRDEVFMREHFQKPPKYYDNEYELIDPDHMAKIRGRRARNFKARSPRQQRDHERYLERVEKQHERDTL